MPMFFISCKDNKQESVQTNSTSSENFQNIDSLDWLLGNWEIRNGEEFSRENWSKENSSAYIAYSYTEVNETTVFAETMALEQKDNEIILTVASATDKSENPVSFKMISSKLNEVTFENKDNSFPKIITYSNKQKDTLRATIQGILEGKEKTVEFSYYKTD